MLDRELINAEMRVYALKLERMEARQAAFERAFINAHAKQALRLFEELREQNWDLAPERGVLYRMLREQVRRERMHGAEGNLKQAGERFLKCGAGHQQVQYNQYPTKLWGRKTIAER